jgi:hypothetical protein
MTRYRLAVFVVTLCIGVSGASDRLTKNLTVYRVTPVNLTGIR